MRPILVLVLPVLLGGCAGLLNVPLECPDALPPEPVRCPEPVLCQCPEPQKILVPAPVPQPHQEDRQLLVLGGVEWVRVDAAGIKAKARIDTGARTSSLHADSLLEFERDGKAWVRFSFNGGEGEKAVILEKPIERHVRIKRHGERAQRRQVVKILLLVGELKAIVDVTLSDRSDFEFPVLVGRNFLTDNAMVDVSRQFVTH